MRSSENCGRCEKTAIRGSSEKMWQRLSDTVIREKPFVSGMYSEKTGKSYSAYLVLTDDGQKSSYALEFDREKTGA